MTKSKLNAYKNDRTRSLRHGATSKVFVNIWIISISWVLTALWFTPVLENNSPDSKTVYSTYHGYATTNYYR